MLRSRVLTASVLAIVLVAAVVWLTPAQLALLIGAVGLAAGWEWARLAGLVAINGRLGFLLLLALAMGASWWIGIEQVASLLLPVVLLFWIAVTAWLVGGGHPRTAPTGPRLRWLLAGAVLLPALFVSILTLVGLPAGRGLLLYALFLVFAADTGAYFTGRRFGRRRLAPAVSAGKTWEGLIGGLFGATVFSGLAAIGFGIEAALWPYWLAIGIVAAGLSVSGDLFESVLKREAGVKDSGTLLPGHGGLLDRADSLLAALPVQALGIGWLYGAISP